jgi:hypothetical protein
MPQWLFGGRDGRTAPSPRTARPLMSRNCTTKTVGGTLLRGRVVYGGWTLCEPISRGADVLSAGIGGDITFDLQLAREHDANVRCFDPTIAQKDFDRLLKRFGAAPEVARRLKFMPFGLGGVNYVLNFYIQQNRTYTPGASLSSTPGLRGYDPRPFVRAPILRMPNLIGLVQPFAPEIVKLDIEGAEWGLFAPEDTEMRRWLAQGSAQQIAIEFHDRFINGATRRTARHNVVQMLRQCGFHMRHRSRSAEEVLFVRTRAVEAC